MRRVRRFFSKISAAAPPASRAVAATWAALLFERFWRRFLPLLLVALLFAACCWLAVFALLPPLPRGLLLAVFGGAFIAAAVFLCQLRLPQRGEAQARLERENHLSRGSLSLDAQRLADESDPQALALWQAHKQRLRARLPRLRPPAPRPAIPLYDRNGLRAAVFLLFAVAFCVRLGGSGGRFSDAFYFGARQPLSAMRIDAWVSPPAYTKRPPLYLIAADKAVAGGASAALSVPQGSRLTLRINDGGRGRASLRCAESQGAAARQKEQRVRPEARDGGSLYRLLLVRSAVCRFASPVLRQDWVFTVEADKPPQIAWVKPPERALNGLLKLDYRLSDDYGVQKAWAEIRPAAAVTDSPYFARLTAPAEIINRKNGRLIAWQGLPLPDSAAAEAAKPLIPAPLVPLTVPRPAILPNGAQIGGEATAEADFTANPWAGAEVEIRLLAEDAAGNRSESSAQRLVLPQKTFINPLSRALAEQRRILAQNSAAAPQVAAALDALLLWADKTIPDKSAALALYSVQARLKYVPQADGAAADAAAQNAAREAGLRDAVAYMGAVAEGIDGGKLAAAERRLRQAQQALREALRNGAGQEEIAKLMQNLRAAMQDYIAMLAERGQTPDSDGQGRTMLGESDLDKKLKALEDAAKQGKRGLSEQLLAEFEDLMKNLQVTQGRGAGDGRGKSGKSDRQTQLQQQMDALSDIMRRQQQLLDDTHKNQEQALRGQDGAAQDSQNQALGQRQNRLEQDLQALQKQLEGQGVAPKSGFKDAQSQMGAAGLALRQGDGGQAQMSQTQALQALRQGAQDVMGQMREALRKADAARQGQQSGQGENGESADKNAQDSQGRDPLGRPFGMGQTPQTDSLPSAEAQSRARRILEEIRKKLGNLTPQQEKDYLERLLNFE